MTTPSPLPHTPSSQRPATTAPALAAARAELDAPWSLERTRRILLQRRWTWVRAELVIAEVEVNPDVARSWLPPPLALPAVAAATVFVADYPDTAMGFAYREAGVLLHARLRGAPVLHCAWMVVDDDTAMILGRELLGFPKKLARIEIAERDDHVEVEVARRGVTLLRASFVAGAPTSPRPAFARPIVNVWGPPGAPSVLLCLDVPERAHETRLAVASLRVRGSIADPLDALAMDCERQEGAVTRTNVGLAPARVHTIPPGVRPVGLVSPAWLARQLPLRSL